MNTNETERTPEMPDRRIPLRGLSSKFKVVMAVILSVCSFFLMFFLGEGLGDHALFIGMGAYFLISQYFLSRGNSQAHRKDWPLIIALNFTLLLATVICLEVEPNKGAKLATLCLAILAVACSYAGAALAARTTHSREVTDPGHKLYQTITS
jgi:peptidoglycan/LPS O-acetylase OafA/YrhL